MLIKAGSKEASTAAFAFEPAIPSRDLVASPSERDLELEELRDERDQLADSLKDVRSQFGSAVADATMRGREAAVLEYVRDDQQRDAAFLQSLADARNAFDVMLGRHCAVLARAIATRATQRLVALRERDDDWLARLIARRISEIGDSAVVAVRVSEADFAEARLAILRAELANGTRVEPDASLAAGTALLELRLGTAMIDPCLGVGKLLELLSKEGDDD